MSDITMEQRLQLVNQVRSRYHQDQNDLLHREQLLYGKTSIDRLRRDAKSTYRRNFNYAGNNGSGESMEYDPYDPDGEFPVSQTEPSFGPNAFRLRFMAAVGMFVLILMLDRNGKDLFGMSTDQIFRSIAKDYVAEAGEALANLNFTFDQEK